MLQLNFIRKNTETVLEGLKKRNFSEEQLLVIQDILSKDDLRRKYQQDLDNMLAVVNRRSKEVGEFMKQGNAAGAEAAKAEVSALKEQIRVIEPLQKEIETDLETILLGLPNIPHTSVPWGKTPEENEVWRPWNQPLPDLGAGALPHWELAKKYGIFDLELGVKITGAGFPVFRGKGARLQRALINFFLNEAHKAGYEEIVPPLMVNEATARGTGQIPDKEAQMYYVEKDDLYLIPTAELPVTNIFRDVIVPGADLPVKMTAYTPCFRREAGSYGAHVRGLNRVHQFDKIEIVQITHPENSYDVLHQMLEHVAGLLDKLGLPYRILKLCGGDMGSASAMTYDFEVYSAAQERWLEVSSVSNFETYQTNRMKLRYRDSEGKVQLAHTLNGSALALARIIAALLENYQTSEGIVIPEALRTFTGFDLLD